MRSDDYINKQFFKAIKTNNRATIEKAFKIVYEEYWKLIYHIAFLIVDDKEATEEIVNDVFGNFFNKIDNLEEKRNIKYYLAKSAKNASYDYLKAQSRTLKNVPLLDDVVIKETNIFGFAKEIVSEKEYYIIVEHLMYGKTFEAIGQKIHLSKETTLGIYYRALETIRRKAGILK